MNAQKVEDMLGRAVASCRLPVLGDGAIEAAAPAPGAAARLSSRPCPRPRAGLHVRAPRAPSSAAAAAAAAPGLRPTAPRAGPPRAAPAPAPAPNEPGDAGLSALGVAARPGSARPDTNARGAPGARARRRGGPARALGLAGEAGGGDAAPKPRLWMATETARRARSLGTSRGGRAWLAGSLWTWRPGPRTRGSRALPVPACDAGGPDLAAVGAPEFIPSTGRVLWALSPRVPSPLARVVR